jgi:predicted nucleic acid-binding protein
MRLYMDVSCLNRPFDDQSQLRVRLEAEAVQAIFRQMVGGSWTHVSSEMAEIEIRAMPDERRRARVALLLPEKSAIVRLTTGVWERAGELVRLGFKAADAVHLAAAEAAKAGVFLTCDDRLGRRARRHRRALRVTVANPLDWLKEVTDGHDA